MSLVLDDCYANLGTVIALNSCIYMIGYVGNIIICTVIISNKSLHTTTNVYLLNLAITDLIMLTSALLELLSNNWEATQETLQLYGIERCHISYWVFHTSLSVSIMTITAFTIERYIAICHPFLARRILSIPRAIKLIFVIWIIGSLFGYSIDHGHRPELENNKLLCYWNGIQKIIRAEFIVLFILPFILLMVLYTMVGKKLIESSIIKKNRGTIIETDTSERQNNEIYNRKVFKMLVAVVAAFFIFWGPFHTARLLIVDGNHILASGMIVGCINFYVETTGYILSAAINPIIYNIMSHKFRDAFKEILLKCWHFCCCKQAAKIKNREEEAETAV